MPFLLTSSMMVSENDEDADILPVVPSARLLRQVQGDQHQGYQAVDPDLAGW